MVRGSSFRLLFRVIFFCLSLSFACFYHHGSGDDKQGDKGEHLNEDVFLKQDERVPNLTDKAKHDDGSKAWKKANLSRMSNKGKFGRHENVAIKRKILMPILTIILF